MEFSASQSFQALCIGRILQVEVDVRCFISLWRLRSLDQLRQDPVNLDAAEPQRMYAERIVAVGRCQIPRHWSASVRKHISPRSSISAVLARRRDQHSYGVIIQVLHANTGPPFRRYVRMLTPHSIGSDTASTARLIASRSRKVDMNAP